MSRFGSIFTHRHYDWLASVLRTLRADYAGTDRLLIDEIIEKFADSLAAQSSGFDRSLFLFNVGILTKLKIEPSASRSQPKPEDEL